MIYLHKILPFFLSPLFLAGLLACLGAWKRRPAYVWLAVFGLWIVSTPIVADRVMLVVERGMLRVSAERMPEADAIVVLSGMLNTVQSDQGVTQEWGDADRFFAGLSLFRHAKAPRLVFTGGLLPWQTLSEPEGVVLKAVAVELGVPSEAIQITSPASNTAEEAVALRQLLGSDKRRILLVTSAFHMSRAQALFEQQGFEVLAYPVDFKVGADKSGRVMMDYLPSGHSLAKFELATRELIGRAYYHLRH